MTSATARKTFAFFNKRIDDYNSPSLASILKQTSTLKVKILANKIKDQ